ncbi:MAG: hypothetical protein DHS20C14_07970 [Phycisphaeraceae bacterium]|nr:MAG: hypothetical protein DHS20C14_07970 [Phycisphaeraceae bacterium]
MPTPRIIQSPRAQAAILAIVCALVYLPWLGAGGLTATEGHRAVPGWEMLESGDWVVPRMFSQAYLRKPPGIAWAIGASGAVLGETELGARAPSALAACAMAFVAWGFSWRWFGRRWALAGGIAQALMPWMWTIGRHAEIEALHMLGVQVAGLTVLDLLVRRDRTPGARAVGWVAFAGAGVAWMMLMKGPAGLPALAGAGVAACIVHRRVTPIASWRLWVPALIGAAALVAVLGLIARAIDSTGETAVTQSAAAFLFTPGWALKLAGLAPGALLAMLPVSLVLLFPWGPDARAEVVDPDAGDRYRVARALAWATLATLGVFLLAGVGNVRYAMPAAVFVAPLAAHVARGVLGGADDAGAFMPKRRAIGRVMMLGHPAAVTLALLVGAWVWIATGERAFRATSGRDAGHEIAAMLAPEIGDAAPGEVWADHLIEARPEVLAAARDALGPDAPVFRWVPGLGGMETIPDGTVLVLRVDEGSNEGVLAENLGKISGTRTLGNGGVGAYRYVLVLAGDAGLAPTGSGLTGPEG